MTLIKESDKLQEQGFNERTLEWRGIPLKEMQHKQLIELVINQFRVNIALREELKVTNRILTPYS